MNPPPRLLRPVPDTEHIDGVDGGGDTPSAATSTRPRLAFRTIHGYRRAYRIAGSGPVLLLIHGIGDNSATWDSVHAQLAEHFTVIAPDLLGHGQSDKPRADYSVAAYANGMRDLLAVLDIERVTVVGHSLGGGVAMQFTYQFPHLVERLILVAPGGVTKDVNIVFPHRDNDGGLQAHRAATMYAMRYPRHTDAVTAVGNRSAGRPPIGDGAHRQRPALSQWVLRTVRACRRGVLARRTLASVRTTRRGENVCAHRYALPVLSICPVDRLTRSLLCSNVLDHVFDVRTCDRFVASDTDKCC